MRKKLIKVFEKRYKVSKIHYCLLLTMRYSAFNTKLEVEGRHLRYLSNVLNLKHPDDKS